MLFKPKFLQLIQEKKVTTAFRKWTKPTVKESGTLLTPVGQLKIISVKIVDYPSITDKDIKKAGYESRDELDKEFSLKKDGTIYKIEFKLQADPRIELRESTKLTTDEWFQLEQKLKKLDAGLVKDWTGRTLKAIDKYPGRRALDLADQLGYEKPWFKMRVRKLKTLGLTISLEVGYKLSPRGKEVLKKLK